MKVTRSRPRSRWFVSPRQWFVPRAYFSLTRSLLTIQFRNRGANLALLGTSVGLIFFFALIQSNGLKLRVTYVDTAHNATSDQFLAYIKKITVFTLKEGNEAEAARQVRDDATDLEIIIPPGFGTRDANGRMKTSTMRGSFNPAKSANGQESAQFVNSILTAFSDEIDHVPHPLQLNAQALANTRNPASIEFVFGGLIALNLISGGLYRAAGEFMEYKAKGVLRRIRVSPTPPLNLMMANLTVAVAASAITVMVVAGLGVTVLHVYVGNAATLLITATISLMAYIAIGFAVIGPIRSTSVANNTLQSISLPLTLLVFLPASVLPAWFHSVNWLFPPLLTVDALRESMGQGAGVGVVAGDLLGLLAWFVVATVVAVAFFNFGDEG